MGLVMLVTTRPVCVIAMIMECQGITAPSSFILLLCIVLVLHTHAHTHTRTHTHTHAHTHAHTHTHARTHTYRPYIYQALFNNVILTCGFVFHTVVLMVLRAVLIAIVSVSAAVNLQINSIMIMISFLCSVKLEVGYSYTITIDNRYIRRASFVTFPETKDDLQLEVEVRGGGFDLSIYGGRGVNLSVRLFVCHCVCIFVCACLFCEL